MPLTWKQLKNFVNSLDESELKQQVIVYDEVDDKTFLSNEVQFADEFKIEDLVGKDTPVITFGQVDIK